MRPCARCGQPHSEKTACRWRDIQEHEAKSGKITPESKEQPVKQESNQKSSVKPQSNETVKQKSNACPHCEAHKARVAELEAELDRLNKPFDRKAYMRDYMAKRRQKA